MFFHSIWESWKREANLWGKDKLVLFSLTGMTIRWNFATIHSRLRDRLANSFRKGGKGGKLGIARQNRMAWDLFRIPVIIK